jgi:3',5'-cyclic-AMP phosphodiesterase
MTRFLYIADTHFGARPMMYEQQKGYPEALEQILSAVCEDLSANGGVDFILHGGDMVDATTEENILEAAKAFNLPVPVYLCLGNHDLTTPDAVEQWLELAPQFFANGAPDYTVAAEHCVIHVTPNHWCNRPFYWENEQNAQFFAPQTEWLSHQLGKSLDLPHILLTHSSVYGLPVEQTALPQPYHCPNASFTAQVAGLAAAHENLKCVLGAHNHLNMRLNHDGVEFVTVSALVETPFEFKLFEVTPQRMQMSTISLASRLTFDGEYNQARSFVQGRPADRSLHIDVGAC